MKRICLVFAILLITLLGSSELCAQTEISSVEPKPAEQALLDSIFKLFCDTVNAPRLKYALNRLNKFKWNTDQYALVVDPLLQRMYLLRENNVIRCYVISTGARGLGNVYGSYKTPIGMHKIREKYGKNAYYGSIFGGPGYNTNRVAKIYKAPKDVPEDYVTSRILWLEGLEQGKNKGGEFDTHSRHIYIHGTPEEGLLGKPASHGCIRMYNAEVMELYDIVKSGSLVEILPLDFK